MANREFTETFNIEEDMWESYRRFIEMLRNRVAMSFQDNHAIRFSHNRPVAPVEQNPPTRFFDVEFRTNTHNITVRFRGDTFYFVGYRMEGSDQWLELRHNINNNNNNPQPQIPQIPGSTFLSFGDSYDDLRGAGNVEWHQIMVGRQELIDAVNWLAISTNDRVRARSILVIVLMIAESLRFNIITKHFTTHRTTHAITDYFVTHDTTGDVPDYVTTHRDNEAYHFNNGWITDYLTGWGDLSAPVLHADADANVRFQLPANNLFHLYTIEAVVFIIGIFKGYFFPPGPRPGGRHRRMAGEVVGRPLVEIFSVTINKINGNSNIRGDIYGTIKFSDGLSISQCIYNRGTNDSESIQASEAILLNGPTRCVSAYDYFIFEVALKSKEWLSEDDDVSRGKISWDVMNITTNRYDEILRHQITGQNGASATVKYAVLNNAVQARIEVILINTNGGEVIYVYGKIATHNNIIEEESVLFRTTSNNYINVKPGHMIPLSRSVVAVPLDSTLIVRADLKEFSSFGPNDGIANGQATFSAQLSGTDEQNISTVSPTRHHIKVKVTWSWYVF